MRARVSRLLLALALMACGTQRLYEGGPAAPGEVARVFVFGPGNMACYGLDLEKVDAESLNDLLNHHDVIELSPGAHQLLFEMLYSTSGPRLEVHGNWDAKGRYSPTYESKCGTMHRYEMLIQVTLRPGFTYVAETGKKKDPRSYQQICLNEEPHDSPDAVEHYKLYGRTRDPGGAARRVTCQNGLSIREWYE